MHTNGSHHNAMTWAGIALTVLANLAQLAYVFGILQGRITNLETASVRYEGAFKALDPVPTRVQFAEDALKRMESNVAALSDLKSDVAVIKNQLQLLNDNLKLFQQTFGKQR